MQVGAIWTNSDFYGFSLSYPFTERIWSDAMFFRELIYRFTVEQLRLSAHFTSNKGRTVSSQAHPDTYFAYA